MKTNEDDFASQVLDIALKKGADLAEVYVNSGRSITAEARAGEPHALEHSSGFAYSVRIIKDKRLGFSYSNDPKEPSLAVDKAMSSLEYVEEDEFLNLYIPDGSGQYPRMDIHDPEVSSITTDAALDMAKSIEKAAFNEDARVVNTRKSTARFSEFRAHIINSEGLSHGYASTIASATITVVAQEGEDSQMGWGYGASRFLKDLEIEAAGIEAAHRASSMLGARRAEPLKASLLMDSSVGVDFLSVLSSMLSAENVQKGRSLLEGKLGQPVTGPLFDIIDDPLRPGTPAQRPMDAEGVPCRKNSLISAGVLNGYMHNCYTARKGSLLTTANAVRGGASTLPSVGAQCMYIKPGDVSPDEMVSSVKKGLLVTDAMGVHTINPVSGEFSIGVSGIWIENGQKAYPVKEAVISGNILELFSSLDAIAHDLRFYGGVGSPSLLFSSVDLSA